MSGAPCAFCMDPSSNLGLQSSSRAERSGRCAGYGNSLQSIDIRVDRRHHFVHRHAPEDPHSLAYNRRVAEQRLLDWASAQDSRLTVTSNATIGDVPVTVLVAS